MMVKMRALIALLIARRLTSLITEDKLTQPARDAFLAKHPTTTQLGYLVTCRNCVSVWSGLVTLLLLPLAKYRVVKIVGGALALSEASITADRLLDAQDTGFNL